MNNLTDTLLKTYKPKLAIVAYTPALEGWQNCYLESHEINEEGKLLEGKPLLQSTIEGMVDVFFDERQNRSEIKGIIPPNLLSFEILPGGFSKLIWYRPAEKRKLFFAEQLCLPSGVAWVPAMIYVANKNHLSVYAIQNNTGRPDENEQLYYAPFHNVSNGSVCLGSAKVKKPVEKTYLSIIKYWEDMFWLSEFSHLAGNTNPTKSNLNMLWAKLVGTEIKWADLDNELIEINKVTLKNLL